MVAAGQGVLPSRCAIHRRWPWRRPPATWPAPRLPRDRDFVTSDDGPTAAANRRTLAPAGPGRILPARRGLPPSPRLRRTGRRRRAPWTLRLWPPGDCRAPGRSTAAGALDLQPGACGYRCAPPGASDRRTQARARSRVAQIGLNLAPEAAWVVQSGQNLAGWLAWPHAAATGHGRPTARQTPAPGVAGTVPSVVLAAGAPDLQPAARLACSLLHAPWPRRPPSASACGGRPPAGPGRILRAAGDGRIPVWATVRAGGPLPGSCGPRLQRLAASTHHVTERPDDVTPPLIAQAAQPRRLEFAPEHAGAGFGLHDALLRDATLSDSQRDATRGGPPFPQARRRARHGEDVGAAVEARARHDHPRPS